MGGNGMKSYVIKDAMTIIDPCVHCGESTAFGYGKFVNRLGWDDGWSCAECASPVSYTHLTLPTKA